MLLLPRVLKLLPLKPLSCLSIHRSGQVHRGLSRSDPADNRLVRGVLEDPEQRGRGAGFVLRLVDAIGVHWQSPQRFSPFVHISRFRPGEL